MRENFSLIKGAADACLFVEDSRTADIMRIVFGALSRRSVKVYVAGGWQTVRQMVKGLHGLPAYGWIDRDFRSDDPNQWQNPDCHVFQSSVHEIENYLLDASALNESWLAASVEDIESFMRAEAAKQLYWLACRAVVDGVHEEMQAPFKPKLELSKIDSEEKGIESLLSFDWRTKMAGLVDSELGEERLRAAFAEKVSGYRDDLNSDMWRVTFSGKEIFEAVVAKFIRGNHDISDVARHVVELFITAGSSAIPLDFQYLVAKL